MTLHVTRALLGRDIVDSFFLKKKMQRTLRCSEARQRSGQEVSPVQEQIQASPR